MRTSRAEQCGQAVLTGISRVQRRTWDLANRIGSAEPSLSWTPNCRIANRSGRQDRRTSARPPDAGKVRILRELVPWATAPFPNRYWMALICFVELATAGTVRLEALRQRGAVGSRGQRDPSELPVRLTPLATPHSRPARFRLTTPRGTDHGKPNGRNELGQQRAASPFVRPALRTPCCIAARRP